MAALDGAWLILSAVGVVLAVVASIVAFGPARGRWGAPVVLVARGGEGGPYRASPACTALVHPPAPRTIRRIALCTRLWAAATFFVFVPLGLHLARLLTAGGPGLPALAAVVVGLLTTSGLTLALGLVHAASVVERRAAVSEPSVVLRWSLWHHVLVAVSFLGLGIPSDPAAAVFALFVVTPVCALGLAITLALRDARMLALAHAISGADA